MKSDEILQLSKNYFTSIKPSLPWGSEVLNISHKDELVYISYTYANKRGSMIKSTSEMQSYLRERNINLILSN